MLLRELFDTIIDYKWVKDSADSATARFKIGQGFFNKNLYGFDAVQYQNNTWKVTFYLIKNGKKIYDITGTGNAEMVLSTIKRILLDFLSKKPIDKLIFSSEGKSRTSIYTRLIKSVLPDWDIKIDHAGDTTFFYAMPRHEVETN